MSDIDNELEKIEQGEAWDDSDEVVQVKVKKPLDKVIPVRLPTETWEQLRKEAKELGIGPTTLARMWILERLRLQSISSLEMLFEKLISQEYNPHQLTAREKEILKNISQGVTLKEITENLNISETAMKNHLKSIRHKLDSIPAITQKIKEYA
jgi:DNA-binding CsgD family transcriptional regulator